MHLSGSTQIHASAHIKEQQTRTWRDSMLSSSREQPSGPPPASTLCHYFRVVVLKVRQVRRLSQSDSWEDIKNTKKKKEEEAETTYVL